MELDRGAIERTDFATSRRGYDPAEVDFHLREVAAAVERLQDEVDELSARPETLSQAANERLRRILEAAEASAAEVRTEAGEEARALIEDAQRQVKAMTDEAERRARERDTESETTSAERLSRVDRRTSDLLARADSLDEEADRLLERMRDAMAAAIETLRDDANGLRAERDEPPGESAPATQRSPGEARELEAVDPFESGGPTAVVEPSVEAEPLEGESDEDFESEPEIGRMDEPELDAEAQAEPLGDEVIPEPRGDEALPEPPARTRAVKGSKGARKKATAAAESEVADVKPVGTQSRGDAGGEETDTEGARLIALNMALSGSSREETAEYLRETFGLEDRDLLDDVYDRVQTS